MGTPLSRNFTLEEFCVSATAEKHGIENTPRPVHLQHMRIAAAGMEQVRTLLGDEPIEITSAYRNPEVNALVGGVPNSAHTDGYGVDFKHNRLSAYECAVRIRDSDIQFDQLIYEKSRKIVHISFDRERNRGQVLTQAKGPGTGFQKGIVK